MKLDPLFEIVNHQLSQTQNDALNPTEMIVLRGILQDLTYSEIAQQEGYSPGYLTNVVAPELYRKLSNLVSETVTKKRCRQILEFYTSERTEASFSGSEATDLICEINPGQLPCYPSGAVPLNSPFYIERAPLEEQVYEEIDKPGALIRIKAPREMGKTSLMLRIIDHANRQGYQTICLNLDQIDRAILSDLNRFLRFLCTSAAHQLNLEPKLDDYWDEDIGSKVSCSLYFRSYLLEQIDSPLILALDELHWIFEYPQVAQDVLPLLRSWYEEAKRLPIWQKLRSIVVHSTEIYIPLQIDQSPFNVGLPVRLESFNLDQVYQLAKRYGLDWSESQEAEQLMGLVGGHPALLQIAFYHLSREDLTLAQLLETAPTTSGIYYNHLQRYWLALQEQPELAQAFYSVINATNPVQLEPIIAHKLSSMGLIESLANEVTLSCELYRRYFQENLRASEIEK
ncbi:serine/threonine protein kinase [Candidatus Gracilibacteria bacterium]|nr:serine/threonine protein kinase [Candidatus Gracilibacteria bacterium]NJM88892.1 serine/threonine protein kinase [Hydrococcus sp. RU_2_2]NJP19870.1 serine/threonine protein kinase [Hydrococcus sp. CRU_1_1]